MKRYTGQSDVDTISRTGKNPEIQPSLTFSPEGLFESVNPQLLVVTNLHQSREEGVLFILCLNHHEVSAIFLAGCTVGIYSGLNNVEICTNDEGILQTPVE